MRIRTMVQTANNANGNYIPIMFDSQVEQVMPFVKEAIKQTDNSFSWNSDADGYPKMMYAALWLSIKPVVAKWIKDNMPKAWYLPMYDDDAHEKMMKEYDEIEKNKPQSSN